MITLISSYGRIIKVAIMSLESIRMPLRRGGDLINKKVRDSNKLDGLYFQLNIESQTDNCMKQKT